MKLFYSIRFKLLFSIFVVIALFVPVLVYISAQLGVKQMDVTFYGYTNPQGVRIPGSEDAIMNNTQRWATILAHLVFGSLRESMAKYDVDAMEKIVQMARAQKDIEAVRIFGPNINSKGEGEVRFNGDTPTNPKMVNNIYCGACHNAGGGLNEKGQSLQQKASLVDAQARIDAKLEEATRYVPPPNATPAELAKKGRIIFQGNNPNYEMIVHVYNQPDPCFQCHKSTQKVNGVIQVNVSLKDVVDLLNTMEIQVKTNEENYRKQVIVFGTIFSVLILSILLWIATSIVNKLAKLRYVAERVSLGETDVSLDDIPVSKDEVGELRDSFERMLVAVKFFMMPEEEFPEESL
jgi:methyl-accepting chemotaxis protein